mgnify:FL=1
MKHGALFSKRGLWVICRKVMFVIFLSSSFLTTGIRLKPWHGYSYYFSFLLSDLSFIFSLGGVNVANVSLGKKATTAY